MSIGRYGSGGPYEEIYGYSRAVKAGPWVFSAGCASIVDGRVAHVGDPGAQAREAFGIALSALAGAGASVSDVVRTRMFVTSEADIDAVGRAHGEVFAAVRPTSSVYVIAGLILPELLVEVEVEAYVPEALP
jgi:enamine deaminase RidA (YjgF/YER057c/UK114 family)